MSCLWIIYFFHHLNIKCISKTYPKSTSHRHCYNFSPVISSVLWPEVPNPSFCLHSCPLSACFPEQKRYLKPKPDNITLLLRAPQWLFIILTMRSKPLYSLLQHSPLCFSCMALFPSLSSAPNSCLPWALALALLCAWNIHSPMSAWLASSCHFDLSFI